MAGFKGQAAYAVDAKGRAAIPAKMRAALTAEDNNTFTVTRGFETCIFAYPLGTWRQMEREIGALSGYDREARAFTRLFMMWAEEVSLDGQGRIVLPKPLIAYAGIKDRVLILGAYDHIEIWAPESFSEYLAAEESDYETLAARVMRGQ